MGLYVFPLSLFTRNTIRSGSSYTSISALDNKGGPGVWGPNTGIFCVNIRFILLSIDLESIIIVFSYFGYTRTSAHTACWSVAHGRVRRSRLIKSQ